jgi:hypothetical protein
MRCRNVLDRLEPAFAEVTCQASIRGAFVRSCPTIERAAQPGLKREIAFMMSARALFTISPSSELYPFAVLKILIVAKEVLDLITKDRRQVGQLADVVVEGIQLVDRHGNNLFVNAVFIFHQQRADRAAAYDGARRDRDLRKHHTITWIAIFRERVRDETVVCRIVHRGMQEPVDEQGARHLVEFVFYRHAALRDFDYRVDVVRRIAAGGNLADIHDERPPSHFPTERVT